MCQLGLNALACSQARHLAVMELGDWLFSLTKRPTEQQQRRTESAAADTASERLAASAPTAPTSTAQRADLPLGQQQQPEQQKQPAAQSTLAAGPDASTAGGPVAATVIGDGNRQHSV